MLLKEGELQHLKQKDMSQRIKNYVRGNIMDIFVENYSDEILSVELEALKQNIGHYILKCN